MNRVGKATVSSLLLLGLAGVVTPSHAEAATRHLMRQGEITINQNDVVGVARFVSNNTTYMPIWYVMHVLENAGIHSQWDGKTWTLQTSAGVNAQFPRPGKGNTRIVINGQNAYAVNTIADVDPSSGQETTFMPIWYVMQLTDKMGFHNDWNGSNWGITGNFTQVPILEYHDIGSIPNDPWSMTPDQFNEEMDYLNQNGFHTISLDDLYNAYYGGGSLPSKPIVLTFDDGYESVYQNAYPTLKQYGMKATLFMISNFAFSQPNFMHWDQLKELQDGGVIDVESHTESHALLGKISDSQVMTELTGSKQAISEHTGHEVKYFCYPEGSYSSRVVHDVQKAGYAMAVTSNQGYSSTLNGKYTLKRLEIFEDLPLSAFEDKVNNAFH